MLAIDAFRQDAWTRQDPRLPNDWPALTPEWHRDHALGTDDARRQAVVEIDVLAHGVPLGWEGMSHSKGVIVDRRTKS